MGIALVAPGVALGLGFGRIGLWRPLAQTISSGTASGPVPSDIGTLAAWWDAGTWAGLLGLDGSSLTGWGQAVAALQDQSGNGNNLAPFTVLASGGMPVSAARLNGFLGGTGRVVGAPGTLAPALDTDAGYKTANPLLPANGAWTIYVVWSRPNWRQASGKDSAPITLAMAGSVPLLQADSQGGQGRLIAFPGAAPSVITATLERRHTHAVAIRCQPGIGADVWFDGARIASGVPFQSGQSTDSVLTLLHDGTPLGSAQCWFHESAVWRRSLSDAEMVVLGQCTGRWTLGMRRGVTVVVDGQSNAIIIR